MVSLSLTTTLALIALSAISGCTVPDADSSWTGLFDGESLSGWEVTKFGGEGEVRVIDGAMHLDMGSPLTGVNVLDSPPTESYELEVTAARIEGTDFFCGLTFPVGEDHLTLILGGWGGSISGLSSLDDDDASNNATRTLRGFKLGQDYIATVHVRAATVTVLLDGKVLTQVDRSEHGLSLRPEVEPCRPLGIASFSTRARIKSVRWRPLDTD